MTDLPQPAGQGATTYANPTNTPVLVSQMPGAATPSQALDGIKPGPQTSEFNFSVGAVGLIQVIFAVFIVLVTTNAIHVPGEWVAAATSIDPIVTAWLANNYAQSRATVKAAALASAPGPIQVG